MDTMDTILSAINVNTDTSSTINVKTDTSLSHNLLSVSSGLDMDENASYLLVHPSIGTRKLVALPRKEDGGEDGF